MDIWEINKLQLFLLFAVPGFVSLKVWDLLFAGETRDFQKSFVDVVVYSALNFFFFLVLSVLLRICSWDSLPGLDLPNYKTYESFANLHRNRFYAFLALYALVVPIVWPSLAAIVRTNKLVTKYLPSPIKKPWDYFFSTKRNIPCWVIVHIASGERIAGTYWKKSFASSYPAPEQLYLEEVWILDEHNSFTQPVKNSLGTLISGEHITHIEFLASEPKENKEKEEKKEINLEEKEAASSIQRKFYPKINWINPFMVVSKFVKTVSTPYKRGKL
jgi:hypothetical protein